MELPKRKPIRLRGYDYAQCGAYFITICVRNRHEMLWNKDTETRTRHQEECADNLHEMYSLSEYGLIVEQAIKNIPDIYHEVNVIKYVIMPNHVHLLIETVPGTNHEENGRLLIAPTVSTVVKQFKRSVSKQIGFSFWQKSFHDHIIRNQQDYQMICRYIDENPNKWREDCYYPVKECIRE